MTFLSEEIQPPPPLHQELPITIATLSAAKKKLTLIPLIYFKVAGAPLQRRARRLSRRPGLCHPRVPHLPLHLEYPGTANLRRTLHRLPGNDGFVIWADRAFGPFFGFLMGTWKFLSVVINIAAFRILYIDYLKRIFPIFSFAFAR
ncbi:putative polyamine transporter [Sesamum alatum]|uniref:Polyamine transporter n=1 Tax=Sesamum alatum TaxID=300844 RepID=A0AAE1Y735_9LAMI|nr:putative polyamine transporter [Sesamum alatum]